MGGTTKRTLDEMDRLRAENARLREVDKAARAYYFGYCQDEADEEGICDLKQQMAARDLRDALRNALQ